MGFDLGNNVHLLHNFLGLNILIIECDFSDFLMIIIFRLIHIHDPILDLVSLYVGGPLNQSLLEERQE